MAIRIALTSKTRLLILRCRSIAIIWMLNDRD
jgi:hypothetical protein